MRDIVHVTLVDSGGTLKHVNELRDLFPQYNHVTTTWDGALNRTYNNPCLLHVHTLWGNNTAVELYDQVMGHFVAQNIPIYITIHDYQWLWPNDPTPLQENMSTHPQPEQCALAERIFNQSSLVIFPTERLRDNYTAHLHNITCKTEIVPHCDIPMRIEQTFISNILTVGSRKVINLAYIGYCLPHKGSEVFAHLSRAIRGIGDYEVRFHMYGHRLGSNIPNIIYHDTYVDSQLIQQLHRDNIHVVFMLTLAEETYCYSLSRIINSGLPLVYINRGAFMNRISPSMHPRFFCVNTINDLFLACQSAINLVINNQGVQDFTYMSETPEVNDWYKKNYPTPQH